MSVDSSATTGRLSCNAVATSGESRRSGGIMILVGAGVPSRGSANGCRLSVPSAPSRVVQSWCRPSVQSPVAVQWRVGGAIRSREAARRPRRRASRSTRRHTQSDRTRRPTSVESTAWRGSVPLSRRSPVQSNASNRHQSGPGRVASSTTSTSMGARCGSSFRPSCSRIAVKSDGPFGSTAGGGTPGAGCGICSGVHVSS